VNALRLLIFLFCWCAGSLSAFGHGSVRYMTNSIGRVASKTEILETVMESGHQHDNRLVARLTGTKCHISRTDPFTAEEQAIIRARYEVANARIGVGAETATVGDQVPYSYYKSQRFVRDTLFPGKPVSSVRIPEGYNVDEFVSRQFGGRQVMDNQSLLLERINKALGPLEENAVSDLPNGTVIQGFDVSFH
jgi:hypothetical protein